MQRGERRNIGGVIGWKGYGGFCDGHYATEMDSDG